MIGSLYRMGPEQMPFATMDNVAAGFGLVVAAAVAMTGSLSKSPP